LEISIKNLGFIKECRVKLDGLTVIAGENDTGKSTLTKSIFYALRVLKGIKRSKTFTMDDMLYSVTAKQIFGTNNVEYLKDASIDIVLDKEPINTKLGFGTSASEISQKLQNIDYIPEPIFIETPTIWNLVDTFKNIANIAQQTGIAVKLPYLMNDLAIKLSNNSVNTKNIIDIDTQIRDLISGSFKKDEKGIFFFEKNLQDNKTIRVELINTATGIKYFGILQTLSNNGWLSNGNVLLLDEPEVHLHPKWQLKLAEMIVQLVKSGMRVVVNSHSPYMIEALKKYSELLKIENRTNFYLADNNLIYQEKNSNALTLEKTFEKLSAPFDTFEDIDSKLLEL